MGLLRLILCLCLATAALATEPERTLEPPSVGSPIHPLPPPVVPVPSAPAVPVVAKPLLRRAETRRGAGDLAGAGAAYRAVFQLSPDAAAATTALEQLPSAAPLSAPPVKPAAPAVSPATPAVAPVAPPAPPWSPHRAR